MLQLIKRKYPLQHVCTNRSSYLNYATTKAPTTSTTTKILKYKEQRKNKKERRIQMKSHSDLNSFILLLLLLPLVQLHLIHLLIHCASRHRKIHNVESRISCGRKRQRNYVSDSLSNLSPVSSPLPPTRGSPVLWLLLELLLVD